MTRLRKENADLKTQLSSVQDTNAKYEEDKVEKAKIPPKASKHNKDKDMEDIRNLQLSLQIEEQDRRMSKN